MSLVVEDRQQALRRFVQNFNGRIREFDVCAALDTLEKNGISIKDLFFLSNNHCQSSSHLCESVHVQADGSSSLLLNLGLLVGSSPLPNYFRKIIDSGEILEEEFVHLLQFFNHFLIQNFIQMSWIEKYFFSNWEEMNTLHLHALGLNSISTLHLCFSLIFPELNVAIEKGFKVLKFHCPALQLGTSKLGEKVALGGYILQNILAFTIRLRADTEQSDNDVFWPIEVRERLRVHIFPLLKKIRAYLTVFFSIDHYYRSTYLSYRSFLGYTSLGDAKKNFTWLLYEGMSDNLVVQEKQH